MSLDFTTIKDHPGSAIFFLHNGTEIGTQHFVDLMADVSRKTKKQTLLLDATQNPGRSIVDFYKLKGSQFVIIVRDDDQLHHVWSDGERFDASHIAFTAEQAG